jgi:hypothetical protein
MSGGSRWGATGGSGEVSPPPSPTPPPQPDQPQHRQGRQMSRSPEPAETARNRVCGGVRAPPSPPRVRRTAVNQRVAACSWPVVGISTRTREVGAAQTRDDSPHRLISLVAAAAYADASVAHPWATRVQPRTPPRTDGTSHRSGRTGVITQRETTGNTSLTGPRAGDKEVNEKHNQARRLSAPSGSRTRRYPLRRSGPLNN